MKINKKGDNMNNFKKVGLSALAGSLAAISAQAGEVSWSGDSTVAYTDNESNSSNANSALNTAFSADTGLSVSASGELDNGWTVSTAMDTGTNNTVSSAQLTIGLGDLGTVQFNQVAGAFTNGLDDKLPTAYEETNDGSEHAAQGNSVGGHSSTGSISYKTPSIGLGDASIQAMVDYDPSGSTANSANGVPSGSTANVGSAIATGLSIDTGMGLVLYGAREIINSEKPGATGADAEAIGVHAVFTMGQISAGWGEWYDNAADGGIDYSMEAWSVAFTVNDNLSISYGEMDDTKKTNGSTDVTAGIEAINVAYSMGSMAVKFKNTDTSRANFGAATLDQERNELAVSFSF